MPPNISTRHLARASWRARRGLLENDLIIERFFQTYGDQLEEADIQALEVILSLSDNDLLDLLLARTALPADLTSPATSKILSWLRSV